MTESVKKSFCIVYDTFLDLKKDTEINLNNVVMTLGYSSIDDNGGAIYRIILKSDVKKDYKGESLGKNSKYFAHCIKSFECGYNDLSILKDLNTLTTMVNTQSLSVTANLDIIHESIKELEIKFDSIIDKLQK